MALSVLARVSSDSVACWDLRILANLVNGSMVKCYNGGSSFTTVLVILAL